MLGIRKKTILQLAVLLLLTFSRSSFCSTSEGRMVVESITITTQGENTQNKRAIPKIKTKQGTLFSQADFDEDLRTLSKDFDRVEPIVEFRNGQAVISLILTAKPVIREINISGNEAIPTHKILKTLELYKNDLFDRELFFKNFDALRTLYLKRGYYDSQLSYSHNHNEKEGFIDISIEIKEGRHGRIKKLTISGITRTEASDLGDIVLTKQYSTTTSWFTGAGVYHPDMVEQDLFAITNYFQNKGYADAKVSKEVSTDAKGNITLLIVVDKGPLYTLGHVHIEGFTALSKRLLDKQLLVGPNSLYCPDKIWTGAQKIRSAYARYGYVNTNVDVSFSAHPTLPVYDVTYRVSEGSPYKIGLIKIKGNTHTKHDVILHETSLFPGDTFDRLKLEGTETRLRNTGYFKSVSVYTVHSQLDPLDSNDL